MFSEYSASVTFEITDTVEVLTKYKLINKFDGKQKKTYKMIFP